MCPTTQRSVRAEQDRYSYDAPVHPVSENHEAALTVLRTLREAGHVAYFAGGCVRDMVLGLEPKDYDVATSAPPEAVRPLFRNTQAVGAAFGVVLVRLHGQHVEVATFRTDGSYTDGRRPDDVRYSTPREDALRRDFTINGLFYDPLAGEVIDYVGGRADLEARVLRAIGDPDARFREDHLRLLRAVRFAARFRLAIEPATAAAVKRHAPHLRRISPERVGDECRRMLVAPSRARAFTLLRELALAPELFRFVECAERPTLDLLPHLGDEGGVSFPLALAAAGLSEVCDPPTAAGVLAALGSKPAGSVVRGLRQTLRLSNDESMALDGILTWAGRLLSSAGPRVAVRRRFLASAVATETRALMRALWSAGLAPQAAGPLLADLDARSLEDNAPPPLVTGDDLTAVGLAPGPVFKRLLDTTYDEQLEGRLTTKDAALAFAMGLTRGG